MKKRPIIGGPLDLLGNNKVRASFYACLTAAPLLWVAAPATIAQESRAQLEEIVVTASRRAVSVQDVATSITALGGEKLENMGITNFENIKRAAAGLYLEVPANSSSSSIRIRGVGTAGNSNIDPSVGVMIDGVYQNYPGMAFTELMDIERIEVLRGPQGTLFGRNTTAGVIKIHTRNPVVDQFSGKLQGVVGNLDKREVRGTLNIPLIEDRLAVRVSANNVERDGHTRNIFLDQDSRSQDRDGARIKVLWNATDNLEVLWSSEYQNTASRVDEGLVVYGRDNITSGLPISGEPWEDIAGVLGKSLPPVSLGRVAQNIQGKAEDEVERHILTLDWSLPGHNLKSVSAHEDVNIFLAQDRDRTVLDLSSLTVDSRATVLTQEVVLSSEWEGPFSYLIGAFYQEEDLDNDIPLIDGADLIALRGGLELPSTQIAALRNNNSVAGFTSVTYELTEQLSVTGGLRYTEDTKDMEQTMTFPGFPPISPVDNKQTFREWTWSTDIKYDLTRDKMLYFAYDRGYKSGGFNAQNVSCILSGGLAGCLTSEQLNYEAETTDNLEVGLKSQWLDGRLSINGAIFYQTYDDFQVAEAVQDQAFTFTSNAATVKSKGLEMDVNALLTDNLTLIASLALIDSSYDEFENGPCARPSQPRCMNGVQDLSGRRLDNAPETTANVGLAYQAPVEGVNGLEWFVRGDVSYRSTTYLHVSQDERTKQSGYGLYNAQVGLEGGEGRWKTSLWGKNLSDKDYAQTAISDVGGVTSIQGEPRTYGVTVDWKF